MTILECKRHFKSELSSLYSEAESAELYSIFLYRLVGFDRFQQRRFMHQELLQSDEDEFLQILEQLKTGKPYQQITGESSFYGQTFFVNEHVLIPRPETEELLELAIHHLKMAFPPNETFKILDIGTGSGVIPIVLKKKLPNAEVESWDVSAHALAVARKNATTLGVEVQFFEKNYLEESLTENYDVIISNPPYIGKEETDEISDSVKAYEPTIALFSPTADPLVFYRKIAKDCKKHLNKNGYFFLEINQKLGQETLDVFENDFECQLMKDLSGNDRFVFGRLKRS